MWYGNYSFPKRPFKEWVLHEKRSLNKYADYLANIRMKLQHSFQWFESELLAVWAQRGPPPWIQVNFDGGRRRLQNQTWSSSACVIFVAWDFKGLEGNTCYLLFQVFGEKCLVTPGTMTSMKAELTAASLAIQAIHMLTTNGFEMIQNPSFWNMPKQGPPKQQISIKECFFDECI